MENIYKINCTEKVDKHRNEKKQDKKDERVEARKIKNISEIIKKHKIISLIFATFFILSCLNFCMIYSFIKILDNSNFY